MNSDTITAWQQYAEAATATDTSGPGTVPERLEWTQVPGAGPAEEILGNTQGRRVLELGCGTGATAAFLAMRGGAIVTGIDAAPAQIARAQARWEHPRLSFLNQDAHVYLRHPRRPVDYVVSVFGALDFCSPAELLPLIASRLRPGGTLALSAIHPSWNPPERLPLDSGGFSRRLTRTPHPASWWAANLPTFGLRIRYQRQVTTPGEASPCCLILCATRPSC